MMQFLSYALDEQTPTYGDGAKFAKVIDKCIEHGSSCNQFTYTVSNHVGTHLDCPFHFDSNGKKVTDFEAAFWLCNKVSFIEVGSSQQLIDIELYVSQIDKDAELILIKTGFCHKRNEPAYWQTNPGITASSADFLRKNFLKLKFIGFDFISLTSFLHKDEGKKSHQAFLKNIEKPILIVEDMDLRSLSKAPAKVLISPLRISDADGGQVTVFAWD